MNYVPIVVATYLEVHFSVLKKGVSQYFCLYSVCTSHWCLVMSFWLKVCIYSHTRGVKLGLGLGFMQTSQVLPHFCIFYIFAHRAALLLKMQNVHLLFIITFVSLSLPTYCILMKLNSQ